MFFNSFVKLFDNHSYNFNVNEFNNIDPNIIKFFRTEYRKDWKVALEQYLYKKSKNIETNKKAA